MKKYNVNVICAFCGQGLVPEHRWNMRCDQCKASNNTKTKNNVNIQSRDPAAIIETEHGEKVFVDKFGKDVSNPGYDLQNDRHGKHFTHGRTKWDRKTIL